MLRWDLPLKSYIVQAKQKFQREHIIFCNKVVVVLQSNNVTELLIKIYKAFLNCQREVNFYFLAQFFLSLREDPVWICQFYSSHTPSSIMKQISLVHFKKSLDFNRAVKILVSVHGVFCCVLAQWTQSQLVF